MVLLICANLLHSPLELYMPHMKAAMDILQTLFWTYEFWRANKQNHVGLYLCGLAIKSNTATNVCPLLGLLD